MKIRIKKDATNIYIKTHTDYKGNYKGKDNWERFFNKIAGKVLEVDTESLFKYEYNVKPVKGIMKNQIRLTEEYVEEVIDDIRHGKARCELCGHTSDSTETCTNCGSSDYLEVFFDDDFEDEDDHDYTF